MRNAILIISIFFFLFSCTSYNKSKNLNTQKAQLLNSKFTDINNHYSYKEYKSLIIEYGKNTKFPELK